MGLFTSNVRATTADPASYTKNDPNGSNDSNDPNESVQDDADHRRSSYAQHQKFDLAHITHPRQVHCRRPRAPRPNKRLTF